VQQIIDIGLQSDDDECRLLGTPDAVTLSARVACPGSRRRRFARNRGPILRSVGNELTGLPRGETSATDTRAAHRHQRPVKTGEQRAAVHSSGGNPRDDCQAFLSFVSVTSGRPSDEPCFTPCAGGKRFRRASSSDIETPPFVVSSTTYPFKMFLGVKP
jgi:hypothetical protein